MNILNRFAVEQAVLDMVKLINREYRERPKRERFPLPPITDEQFDENVRREENGEGLR